jgi:hypothetical protein
MPRRPPKKWMRDCVAGASRSARDPGAACGALWYRKMSPEAKRRALSREKRGQARRVEGLSQKAAAAHARVGYFLPGTSFTLRTPTMDEAERHRLAARILKYGDDPYVSVSGVRVQVAPSPRSYEGGALYVAVTEALGHRTWKFDARHNVFEVD